MRSGQSRREFRCGYRINIVCSDRTGIGIVDDQRRSFGGTVRFLRPAGTPGAGGGGRLVKGAAVSQGVEFVLFQVSVKIRLLTKTAVAEMALKQSNHQLKKNPLVKI